MRLVIEPVLGRVSASRRTINDVGMLESRKVEAAQAAHGGYMREKVVMHIGNEAVFAANALRLALRGPLEIFHLAGTGL